VFCADFLGEANLVPGTVLDGGRGERVRVETPFGTWEAVCPAGAAAPAGRRVRCLVRPENLRPAGGLDAGGNRLRAEVSAIRLAGATTTVALKSQGLALKATLLSEYSAGLRPGESAEWAAQPENTVALVEE
jgi:ABC-type Fe3+/spermidine/putrescine transport system ATPase subunit